jgi:hypothetical protein
LIFQLDTSRGGSPFPDLPFHRILWHLRASSNRAEILDLHSYQGGRIFSQGGFGLDFGLSCVGLQLVFSLWRLISSYLDHFVASPIPARGSIECYSKSAVLLYQVVSYYLNKGKIYVVWFHIWCFLLSLVFPYVASSYLWSHA